MKLIEIEKKEMEWSKKVDRAKEKKKIIKIKRIKKQQIGIKEEIIRKQQQQQKQQIAENGETRNVGAETNSREHFA